MKKHNRLSTTLMLGATVGSALVGTVVPLTQAHASAIEPDSWATEGFKEFPYATTATLNGEKLSEQNVPIVAWTNASKLTDGQIDNLLSGGAQGTHYPLFSEVMTANGKTLYCINPFRMSPTEENKAKGYDTTSTPDNNFGATLFQAALHSYPNQKDVDGDGKDGTMLDYITSIYTIWLAHGIASTNYGKNLNSSIRWDDIKDNFSNSLAQLGGNYGWVLNGYKTLSSSDQAKVKKSN